MKKMKMWQVVIGRAKRAEEERGPKEAAVIGQKRAGRGESSESVRRGSEAVMRWTW